MVGAGVGLVRATTVGTKRQGQGVVSEEGLVRIRKRWMA